MLSVTPPHLWTMAATIAVENICGGMGTAAFVALLEAQVELDEFDARSADAFSYDDGIRFVRRGAVLEIEELDADAGTFRMLEPVFQS